MKRFVFLAVFLSGFTFLSLHTVKAQSPGLLVKPKNGNGSTFLNPNGDKYTSATKDGFVLSDVSESEIPYKIIPSVVPEPTGDNNGGMSDAATDYVMGADGSGFYTYYDGTNLMFRFRVGGISNGARAYSVLIDTDLKVGSTGFYADPNFVPQSNPRSGNPGFELEILYAQGKGVQILNVDGTVSGTLLKTYDETTHSQISVALSKVGGDADYFIDFGVPAADLGIGTKYVRLVGTTCISPNSALNNNASDVWGIDDIPHKSLIPNWTSLINMQCGTGVTELTKDGPGICICTPAPVVDGPIAGGTDVAVTGTWNRLSSLYSATTSLTLFRNSTAVATITANTGTTWSITVPSLQTGDTLWATAVSAPESQCGTSNRVVVGCANNVAAPTITCATEKGMEGTIPLGATVEIYEVSWSNDGGTLTPRKLAESGFEYIQASGATSRTFKYWGTNNRSGSACSGGSAQLGNVNYYVVVNAGGCLSSPFFMCITLNGWSQPAQSSTLVLNNPIYNGQTSVSGSGGSTSGASNKNYRLYINNKYVAGALSNTGSFTFSNLTPLKTGDKVVVYEAANLGLCQTFSPTYTVQCTQPSAPTIISVNGEISTAATSISGYASIPGATVTLYKSGNPAAAVGTAIVNNTGDWTVSGLSITNNTTYFATQSFEGCTSAASASVETAKPTTLCPVINGTYTESAKAINGSFSSAFTGTLRLYNNGGLLKTVSLTGATTWSVPVNSDLTYYTDVLTPGDTLHVTTEADKLLESGRCAICVIGCDVPPSPNATPTSVTISSGQETTFSLATTSSKALYSLVDDNNNTYATSMFGTGGSITIPTYPFKNAGTYNLKVVADNMEAPECRTTQDVVVTVNTSTLPLKFMGVAVKSSSPLQKNISWTVASEENISHYVVERSFNCTTYEAIATVSYQPLGGVTKQYSFTDVLPATQKQLCYRVKAVESNGAVWYSKVVSLSESAKGQAVLAPNPATAETTVYVYSEREQVLKLEMLDMTGRPVLAKEVRVTEGRNAVLLNGLQKYARGQYLLKLRIGQDVSHLKLVLEK